MAQVIAGLTAARASSKHRQGTELCSGVPELPGQMALPCPLAAARPRGQSRGSHTLPIPPAEHQPTHCLPDALLRVLPLRTGGTFGWCTSFHPTPRLTIHATFLLVG